MTTNQKQGPETAFWEASGVFLGEWSPNRKLTQPASQRANRLTHRRGLQ
jgi:hypothetical protein